MHYKTHLDGHSQFWRHLTTKHLDDHTGVHLKAVDKNSFTKKVHLVVDLEHGLAVLKEFRKMKTHSTTTTGQLHLLWKMVRFAQKLHNSY